jgi:GTP 3',8-cyclase
MPMRYYGPLSSTWPAQYVIVDGQGRRFRNLRVSLTAACNYACDYCVPNGKRLIAAQDELSADQMIRAVSLLIAAAGIEKLRITGGEPLLSAKFEPFLRAVMQQPLRDVAITTNGQLLQAKAEVLLTAGVKRLNVSLDTLDATAFPRIARGGDLDTVLRGIETMCAAGVRLKINMVPMRHANLEQILPMLEFCMSRGIELRYIELMNMGHLKRSPDYARQFVGQAEILEAIGTRYQFVRTDAAYDSTSIRYEIPGHGVFGIIANESEPFCSACTRLRLSSNGYLYGCLSNTNRHYVGDLLDLPDHVALVRLQALLLGALGDKQSHAFHGEVTVMKFIGG